ncbi:hypothetical protein D910_01368 [Dendroctonus ponderosae]|uniref:Uncharacterized protein n=1 Tax=Dendroctonus ponderosae TaxID=77166 RepID=U4TTF3_DENPD|nr:hypothetical protein D910_01368 [Dendroctonus ponderosae]
MHEFNMECCTNFKSEARAEQINHLSGKYPDKGNTGTSQEQTFVANSPDSNKTWL